MARWITAASILRPVGRRQDEGHDVELPGPRLAAAVVIDVVGDAIVLDRGARGAAWRRSNSSGDSAVRVRAKARQCGRIAPVAVAQLVKARGPSCAWRFGDFRHAATQTPRLKSRV